MDGHGREYRRRQPEQTVLYEAVRENLATFLEEASQQGRGLPRYVERDFTRYLDVFACRRCGGRRRVLASLTARQGVRAILEHLGLPSQPPRLAQAQGPPQSAWC